MFSNISKKPCILRIFIEKDPTKMSQKDLFMFSKIFEKY
ncbi:hypothetical protein P689_11929 [Candidatus Riesia pediculischaeffi PTSU]|uniref:Uncharacterized protein n=1 Tax=Candidatus Riesia pediculischaeffi PTSU TaxID=1401651 RepID=A0A0C1V872_9ENTR|nr:hypothetical protein P689_11929 [Candidatus Riesia pediculischaeffi PTSU]